MKRAGLWTRRISRREVMRAAGRAGVAAGAFALAGEAAETAESVPHGVKSGEGQADPPKQRGTSEGLVFPYIGVSSGNPLTLDPYESQTYRSQHATKYHYSNLLQPVTGGPGVDPVQSAPLEPDLATALPEMPDSTTYIFRLRNNARWHDVEPLNGRQVTVEDVVLSYDRFLGYSPNSRSWGQIVEAFEPALDQSITVRLHRPHAPFLNLVGSPQHLAIVPQEIVDDGSVRHRPVGSGPWIFEEFEPDVALRWRRNPAWHRRADFGRWNVPLAPSLTATMNANPDVIIGSLASGGFDFSSLSASTFELMKERVQDRPNYGEDDFFTFTKNTVPGGFYFNFSIPPWNDTRMRVALSRSLDRDAVLDQIDDTGRGGWHSAISQLPPFWLDPKDLSAFGEQYGGADSGINFHANIAEARKLMDAAGYPSGLTATCHDTTAYGAWANDFFKACVDSVRNAGFRFEIDSKEYAPYAASTFRGNFPDDWDGESSHLAIGPLIGGALDPDDIFAACYDRSSGLHNWGAAGRISGNSVGHLDTGGNAGRWFHSNAAAGGGPEADERLHEMFERQRAILDLDERIEYVNDIQRYMATQMYLVPYPANAGVWAVNPWVRQFDYPGVHIKATYGRAHEFLPALYIDRDSPRQPTSASPAGSSTSVRNGRIMARRLSDGQIEFGFQPARGQLARPASRFLPAKPPIGRWLNSSDVMLAGIAVGRISARRLADGRTEFSFVTAGGERISPRVRLFPAGGSATCWLQSSPL